MADLTHASFFSGVGGTDLGLERAGWRTVSFSEVDPYACAVLGERWPETPNLGDITDGRRFGQQRESADHRGNGAASDDQQQLGRDTTWSAASLWSGGFPCQDLSVAGKRAGFTGERSVLAFAFLDLVERYRPPAILLENVPGLLSSHGVAYRVLEELFRAYGVRRNAPTEQVRDVTMRGAAEHAATITQDRFGRGRVASLSPPSRS